MRSGDAARRTRRVAGPLPVALRRRVARGRLRGRPSATSRPGASVDRLEHPVVLRDAGEPAGGEIEAAFEAEVGAFVGAGLDIVPVDPQGGRAEETLGL